MASRSCEEQADWTVSRLLFTYMIISPRIVPLFSSVCAHKVEQMGCWMCLFHMTHFCLVQLEWFCFPCLLKEVLLHLFALKTLSFWFCSGMLSFAPPCAANPCKVSVNTSSFVSCWTQTFLVFTFCLQSHGLFLLAFLLNALWEVYCLNFFYLLQVSLLRFFATLSGHKSGAKGAD